MAPSAWLALASLSTPVLSFEYKERLACGVCLQMSEFNHSCDFYGSCHHVNESSVAKGCSDVCEAPDLTIYSDSPDLRVAKGFGTKDYDQVRISVISQSAEPPVEGFFDYSQAFRYKWSDNYLHTAMKQVVPGQATEFDLGSTKVSVKVPKQGDGVVGVLIADPCVAGSPVGCTYADEFQTADRTPGLINACVGDASTDFWGIYGDNFYDRDGSISRSIFSKISLQAKSKIFTSVTGNHDFWVLGAPIVGTTKDQCGNGHLQFYAQDAKASEQVSAGSSEDPYDFSVDPDANRPLGSGCNLPALENHFWYNQIGNVGLVGQSGAYALSDATPFMKEACTWLGQQPGLEVGILLGHWDKSGLGADKDMAMPAWFEEMAAYPGCAELSQRGMLKFVMGHTHCNNPHPHGEVDKGFRVAGFGMSDSCPTGTRYGMPLVDTTEGRIRFWYFDTMSDESYNNVTACVTAKGWRQCTDMAILWLDQELTPKSAGLEV
jgi:hypothetical protein